MSARSVGIVLASLAVVVGGSLGCTTTPKFQAGGVDESQFATDPSLRANLGQAIAVHLESAAGGFMAEDTLTPGVDAIPYAVAFTPEYSGTVEFCFDYPKPHTLDVQNADGKTIASLTAGEGCSTHFLKNGEYVLHFTHAPYEPGDTVSVSELFVQGTIPIARPSRRISITSSCDHCQLITTRLKNANFSDSGTGLLGTDFTDADLSGTHFFGANMFGTHFFNTTMTGTRLAGTGAQLTAALILKTWELFETPTVFSFEMQYEFNGAAPTIAVGISEDGSTIWATTHALTPDEPLAVDVKTPSGDTIQGALNIVHLPTPYFDNDRAIWGKLRYTLLGVEHRFEGVMRTYHSSGRYSTASSSPNGDDEMPQVEATLTFVNESAAAEPPEVVLFTQPPASEARSPIAWRVIRPTTSEPTLVGVPAALSAETTLPSGGTSDRLPAGEGELFALAELSGAETFVALGRSTNPSLVQVINALPDGAITASIYRSDRLAFSAPNLQPHDKASFPVSPVLSAAVMSDVNEGQILSDAMLRVPTSRFDLLGVSSADVVMTGSGTSEDPYVFDFSNVKLR